MDVRSHLPLILINALPLQTLFFKAHIFAGQAKPNGKSAKDFAWLTTEEIKEKVAPEYWASIRDMLSEK